MENVVVLVLACLCAVFAIGFSVFVYLWYKAKMEPGDIKVQLERLQQTADMERNNFNTRMQEKDVACQNALAGKDAACQKLIDAKDEACAQAIADKTTTCERLIADKEAACSRQLAAKDENYSKAIAEKDNSMAQILKEKDAAMAKKEATWQQMLTEKDLACAKAIEEKEVACRKIIEEKEAAIKSREAACEQSLVAKDQSTKKILEEKELAIKSREEACTVALQEKDAAMAKKEATWQQMLTEKDLACAKAIEEKEVACRKIIEEKEAAIKSREAACEQSLVAKDQSTKKILEEKELAIKSREEACAVALQEKDTACARVIAEKDTELKRKDEDVRRMLAEKNVEIDRFLKEKEKSFAEVVKTLQEQFANLAAQTLKMQSGDLTKKNSEQLEGVLKPLRDQLEILRSATEKTQSEHAKLAESIGKDVGRISDVAKELAGVSEALSSNSGFQGRKGEEILAEKLRQAGLEEKVNFFLQTGTSSDRPDAQVCDPENRWLIIDSKVVLTAYFQYVEAKDEKTRQTKLAEHVARVREKINQLARKNYPKVFSEEHKDRNYLPVTAMFVGYEAPLLEALKAEPSLWKYAADNNVILVTPLTLLAYLRLVYLAWQHEKEARNQAEIVDTARELLKRMNAFLVTFESIGDSLVDMEKKYGEARSVLVDTPRAQTIAKAANKLIDLGVQLESRRGRRIERAECLKEIGNENTVKIEVEVTDANVEDNKGALVYD